MTDPLTGPNAELVAKLLEGFPSADLGPDDLVARCLTDFAKAWPAIKAQVGENEEVEMRIFIVKKKDGDE